MIFRTMLAVATIAAVPLIASAQTTDTQTKSENCNPVINRYGIPVISRSQDQVRSTFSTNCPQSATPAAAETSASGSASQPAPASAPQQGEVVTLSGDVSFDFDQAVLRPEALAVLNDLAGKLRANPGVRIAVTGHTDSKGTDAYNQALSQRRAQAVATYLASQGIAADRMTVTGFGESMPVTTNETEDGRARNRRVEIIVL